MARQQWVRSVVRERECDVVVIGGGAAGVAAAVSAADAGADTLLVERFPVLGGTTTMSGVAHFQIGPDVDGMPIVQGHYANVLRRLYEKGVLRGRTFAGEVIKGVYLKMLEDAGANLMLHATFTDVEKDGERIAAVAVETKSGLEVIVPKVVVDASADGDVGFKAGAPYREGRPEDGQMQPMTLYMTLANVDYEVVRTLDSADYYPIFQRELPHIHTAQARLGYTPQFAVNPSGRASFTMMHIRGRNAADADSLTRAEVESRHQTHEIWQFFRRHVPGFENAILESAPAMIGIRESRRILGEYVMSRRDIVGNVRFDDTIGRSNSFNDVHNPDGEGTLHEYMNRGTWYDIPHRALITRDIANLYTVGRCMSTTHYALGSLREQPTCMVTGQAAGVGAAIAARQGIGPREIDINDLQRELVDQSVDLGPRFEQVFEKGPWFGNEFGPKYGQPLIVEGGQPLFAAASGRIG
jgi:hypothetical protein